MIFRSLIPLVIIIFVMMMIILYMTTVIKPQLKELLYVENGYLLTDNVFLQLNKSIVPEVNYGACIVINHPMTYTCNDLLLNTTRLVNYVLNVITNDTKDTVHYDIINYSINEAGNSTVIYITIRAYYGNYTVTKTIMVQLPIEICTYIAEVRELAELNNTEHVIMVRDITDVESALNSLIKSYINRDGVQLIIRYMAIFQRDTIEDNETYYYGTLQYSVIPTNILIDNCKVNPNINGEMNILLIINGNVTNVRDFEINGVVIT